MPLRFLLSCCVLFGVAVIVGADDRDPSSSDSPKRPAERPICEGSWSLSKGRRVNFYSRKLDVAYLGDFGTTTGRAEYWWLELSGPRSEKRTLWGSQLQENKGFYLERISNVFVVQRNDSVAALAWWGWFGAERGFWFFDVPLDPGVAPKDLPAGPDHTWYGKALVPAEVVDLRGLKLPKTARGVTEDAAFVDVDVLLLDARAISKWRVARERRIECVEWVKDHWEVDLESERDEGDDLKITLRRDDAIWTLKSLQQSESALE